MTPLRPARVLFTIAVYNGRSFIDRTLDSAARVDRDGLDIDVLIMDDASPAPGFGEYVADACARRGLSSYRSPRNQGLVRSLNVAMRWAQRGGYDYVILANSDVIYPANLVTGMVGAAQRTPDAGAVVAWSNNMSAFSLHNDEAERFLASQDRVDAVSGCLAAEFGDEVIETPCGVGFCWMIPVPVLDKVGIHDTIFDRGYCEETDWTLRARQAGYRIVLAPSVFAYHEGNVSMLDAGVLRPGEISVDANEAIIDLRYPDFRDEVQGFEDDGVLERARDRAVQALVREAIGRFGYEVEVGWLRHPQHRGDIPHALIHPDHMAAHIEVSYLGFGATVFFEDFDGPQAIRTYFGAEPRRVFIRDVGEQATKVEEAFAASGALIERHVDYPQRVLG